MINRFTYVTGMTIPLPASINSLNLGTCNITRKPLNAPDFGISLVFFRIFARQRCAAVAVSLVSPSKHALGLPHSYNSS